MVVGMLAQGFRHCLAGLQPICMCLSPRAGSALDPILWTAQGDSSNTCMGNPAWDLGSLLWPFPTLDISPIMNKQARTKCIYVFQTNQNKIILKLSEKFEKSCFIRYGGSS